MRAYFRHTSPLPRPPHCALTHASIVTAIWIRDEIIRFRTRVSCKRELGERSESRSVSTRVEEIRGTGIGERKVGKR